MAFDKEADGSKNSRRHSSLVPVSTIPLSARKVPIPRTSHDAAVPVGNRVKKACAHCKDSKAKCSGAQPCHRCVSLGLVCGFNEGKRQIQARVFREIQSKLDVYEGLLRRLMNIVDDKERDLIVATLDLDEKIENEFPSPSPSSSSVGADYVEEDYNQNSRLRAFGFVGDISEVSWMKSLKQEIEATMSARPPKQPSVTEAAAMDSTSVSYFLDDHELLLEEGVALYKRPPRSVADKLLNIYFYMVQPSFPIIGKIPFLKQYSLYYSASDIQPPSRWLAVLNLAFALGAKYTEMASQASASDLGSSTEYFSRAYRLGLSHFPVLDHPSLQQVQIEGLTAFYLMTIGHINRAWRTCGLAIRSAIALGINRRNESRQTTNSSKELRYRVWWSVYTAENTLSIMTGRPTSAGDGFCTTPFPIPYDEDQFDDPNASRLLSHFQFRQDFMQDFAARKLREIPLQAPEGRAPSSSTEQFSNITILHVPTSYSLYFFYFLDITKVMRRATNLLYAPGSLKRPWFRVQETITGFANETNAWYECLPDDFKFKTASSSKLFERQRWSLAFRFYSVQITISRPSLCRFDRQKADYGSAGPCQINGMNICVTAACDMLALLTDIPDVLWLIRVSPWWCVLHYLMQSVTVLLIELDSCLRFGPQPTSVLTSSLEKGMSWIHAMAKDSMAAHRAWDVCHGLYCSISETRSDQLDVTLRDLSGVLPVEKDSLPSQALAADVSLPDNAIVHPDLRTMYDQFIPSYLEQQFHQQ
ncbi:fungal-specific transcription factor domain-containing protein [Aspergillus floccosus]